MSTSTARRRSRLAALVALGVVALVFWTSPWLLPLKLVVVLFHELGHAVAAWATGGAVEEISVSWNQGGFARTRGGNAFIVLNAGYLGSLAWGVVLLYLGRRTRTARIAAGILAVLLAAVALLFTSWLGFAQGFTLAAALALAAAARWAPPEMTAFGLRALGVFSVLYALWDIREDALRWGGSASTASDAAQLAAMTQVPAACWGLAWLAAGIAVLFVLRRHLL